MGTTPDVEVLQALEMYQSLKLFVSKKYEKGSGNKIRKTQEEKNMANKILMGFLSGAGVKTKARLSNSGSWV